MMLSKFFACRIVLVRFKFASRRSALNLAKAAMEAAASEAIWRMTRGDDADHESGRTVEEELVARQSGQVPDPAEAAAWRDRSAADQEVAEASARARESASAKQALIVTDPAWPKMEEGAAPAATVIEPAPEREGKLTERTEPAASESSADEVIVADTPPLTAQEEGGAGRRLRRLVRCGPHRPQATPTPMLAPEWLSRPGPLWAPRHCVGEGPAPRLP